MKGPQNSETFLRAANACSDFRMPERPLGCLSGRGTEGSREEGPTGDAWDERERLYHQPSPPQTGVNAPHPVTRATLQYDTGAQDSASRATRRRSGTSQAGRWDFEASQTPPCLGCLARWGETYAPPARVRGSATRSSPAAPRPSPPHVAAVIVSQRYPSAPPPQSPSAFPGPSESGHRGRIARTRARTPRRDRGELVAPR